MPIKIEESSFGKLDDKSEVKLYRLTNKNGMSVEVGILFYLRKLLSRFRSLFIHYTPFNLNYVQNNKYI